MLVHFFLLVGKGGQKSGAKGEKTLNDFAVEYAKSNRSTCKGCEQKIEKVSFNFQRKKKRWYVDVNAVCVVSVISLRPLL